MSTPDLLLRDVRLVGGDSRTGGSTAPVDVALRRGWVAAIGADLHAGPVDSTRELDLDGRYLVPGLWDEHVHAEQWALVRRWLDLTPATSAAHAGRLVADRLATAKPEDGEVLVGYGYRDGLWPDVPERQLLDAAGGSVAVALKSHDLHAIWLNHAAQRHFGVPETDTGVLVETDAAAIGRDVDRVPADLLDTWVDDAARAAASRGVVGVVDLERPWSYDDWSRRVAAGTRSLRVECGVYPELLDEVLARGLSSGATAPGTDGLVVAGPLKVLSDGSLNTRTACCHDAYPGTGGKGMLLVPPDVLGSLLRRAGEHGIGAAVHAIGDRAVTLALDAFEAAGVRGRMEHAQLVRPEDLPRFARLGVVASVQPQHALDDRDVADHYWAGRTDRAFPLRSLLDAGAGLAIGSDAPVAPLDPWVSMAAAVRRNDDARAPWHAEQQLSVAEAMAACTRGRRIVRVGDPADLAVADLDPTSVDATTLRTMPVAGTLLGGQLTHAAGLDDELA